MNKNIFFAYFLLGSCLLFAQKKEKGVFNFEVIADSYFKTDINSTNSNKTTKNTPPTPFADKSGFALGMVNAIASYTSTKTTFVVDLVEGPRGVVASKSRINQLFVKYRPIPKIEITFGKFNSYLGYEMISPKDNFNYSTSYLFLSSPFSHTGINFRYHFDKNQSLMFGIMNANDDTKFNSTDTYTLGLQYSFYKQHINIIYGNKDENIETRKNIEIDYTGGFDLSDSFFLGIDVSCKVASDKSIKGNFGYYGAALYGLYTVTPKFKLGLRPEYFVEYKGDEKSKSLAATLSGNLALTKNLMVIPEFRTDYNRDKPFVGTNLLPQKSLSSFLVGVVFHFDKDF